MDSGLDDRFRIGSFCSGVSEGGNWMAVSQSDEFSGLLGVSGFGLDIESM